MFSTQSTEPSRDIYFVCVGSTNTSNTSNVGKSLMADKGKVLYGGYVSEK